METTSTIGVLVLKRDQVLLVKHTEASRNITGIYGLPAGHVEENETEAEAAVRELHEETGLRTDVKDVVQLPTTYLGTLQRKNKSGGYTPKQYSWKVFRVLRFTGELTPSVETIPEWVNVVDLSKHQLLPNVSNAVAEALAQGFENHPMSKQEGVA